MGNYEHYSSAANRSCNAQSPTMAGSERLIMVIDQSDDRADGLKELIEFMDAPDVCTATPGNWQARMGTNRLAAIFVNEELPAADMSGLLDNIGKLDPNVPIVLISSERHA